MRPAYVVITKELRPGDILVACRREDTESWSAWHKDEDGYDHDVIEVASELRPKRVGSKQKLYYFFQFKRNGDLVSHEEDRPAELLWKIYRDGPSMGAARYIDEFPGKCTRCGRKAYVGSFEVMHQDERAAADCPARRK